MHRLDSDFFDELSLINVINSSGNQLVSISAEVDALIKVEKKKTRTEMWCDYRRKLNASIRKCKWDSGFLRSIGYTRADLVSHLQNRFKPGMTWANKGDWHIDHIKPCKLFDPFNFNDVIECFSLKNLQPLWAQENHDKGDKY